MGKLTYTRLMCDDADIPRFAEIYNMPEISRFLSISDNYFNYVTNTENVYFYKVYNCDELIGTIHLENQGAILFMDILIFPKFQRKGFGAEIIRDIQNNIFGLNFEKIEISIDKSNLASLKLFKNAGFEFVSKENELLNYIYNSNV